MITYMIEQCGSEMVGAVWVTEMSSPFLHLRELLKELGFKDTPLNLSADVSKPVDIVPIILRKLLRYFFANR
jgi:hypothetical protein